MIKFWWQLTLTFDPENYFRNFCWHLVGPYLTRENPSPSVFGGTLNLTQLQRQRHLRNFCIRKLPITWKLLARFRYIAILDVSQLGLRIDWNLSLWSWELHLSEYATLKLRNVLKQKDQNDSFASCKFFSVHVWCAHYKHCRILWFSARLTFYWVSLVRLLDRKLIYDDWQIAWHRIDLN